MSDCTHRTLFRGANRFFVSRSLMLRPTDSPSRLATLYTGGSDDFVTSATRSDCYRMERSSSRAGLIPAVGQRLFTAL